MNRQIYNDLLLWKSRTDRKPLMLLGARQVGKTWIMKYFGHQEYQSVAYINCDDDPHVEQLFADDYNIDRILTLIQAMTGVNPLPEKTLIIFDEIQQVPRGLHSLKYFCEKAPQYHVMVAGSLLGITLAHHESFPVGKLDILQMHPLSFCEFLDAVGQPQLVELIRNMNWDVINILHDKFEYLLRQYFYVGGMPGVVANFIENNDLAEVRRIQSDIITSYRNDISKHTTSAQSVRIGMVLQSLPSQLAKENKKFIYGAVRKGARAADFEMAIQWLIDAGIVHKVPQITKPGLPLKFYESLNAFKLFFVDCGLLACMVEASADQMLLDNSLFVEFKGAFTEQFVLQEFVARGICPYYWSNSATPAEIDFIIQHNNRVIPIEVKASTNVRSRSLAQFIKDNPSLKGLRLSLCPYIDQEWMENRPLYTIASL